MSGPKTSRYTLTPEQRRILEEQRKLQQRIEAAKAITQANNKKITELLETAKEGKKTAALLLERGQTDRGFTEKLSQLEKLIAPVTGRIAATETTAEAMEATAQYLAETAAKAEALTRELSAAAGENQAALEGKLNEALDRGFTASFADLTAPDPMEAEKTQLMKKLLQMRAEPALSRQDKKELQVALDTLERMEDAEFFKNFSAVTAAPLLGRCAQYLKEYRAYHEEFDTLLARYQALCGMYGQKKQAFTFSREAIARLQLEVERLEAAAREDEEQAYISRCMDEVMAEMGYSVLGSRHVTKKNGKHFRNALYTYGEGTAVNVTYAADGRIAMELGGLDTTDRLPSAAETDALCRSMDRFCGDFAEIERRLLAKGVVAAQRIRMLPVSAEYAQIINTSDYEMTAQAASFTVKKQETAAKKKALHKE